MNFNEDRVEKSKQLEARGAKEDNEVGSRIENLLMFSLKNPWKTQEKELSQYSRVIIRSLNVIFSNDISTMTDDMCRSIMS